MMACCNSFNMSGCSPIWAHNCKSLLFWLAPSVCCNAGKTARVLRNTNKSRGRADFSAIRELILSISPICLK